MLEALAASGAVVGLAVALRSREPARAGHAAIAAAGVSLAVSLVALLASGRTSGALSLVESLALVALVFLVVRRVRRPLAIAAGIVVVAAALLIVPAHETTSDSLAANLAGMAVWGSGALLAAGAARYLHELDERRERGIADARRQQRLALARDLHDFVAHDVSAIVAQAQAARLVGDAGALERIERSGLHALAAMDRAVEALDDAARESHAVAGLRDVAGLAARFGPPEVELDVDEHAFAAAPADVDLTAYRVVSEGLTNVRRHAPAARRVQVRVAAARLGDAPALAVTVRNDAGSNGSSSAEDRRNGGFGLRALRERVEALGGTLRAGPEDGGGWRLSVLLPVDGA